MRRIILLFITLLSLTGCCCFSGKWGGGGITLTNPCPMCDPAQDDPEMSNIVITFGEAMFHKHHLTLEKSLCKHVDGNVAKVSIYFSSQDIVELCEARDTLVDATEEFLRMINDNGYITPALYHRPFSFEEVNIYIVYESYFVQYVDPTYIAYAILEDGNAFYYSGEVNNINAVAWDQRVEPYIKTRTFAYQRRAAQEPYIEAERLKKEEERKKKFYEERLTDYY
ncbi:MAG: hypothetical protein H7A37_07155 [Chlamydiales bacterium]|nr:hypothetical protein [Chlamydiia bacterium]MCP5508060.1 hypothetical protein [Chlamydiales bacterium]